MTKPVLSDRLARWYLQLQQFEITYVPQKAVKGQVLADFLADHPMSAEWELSDDLPNEDILVIEITPPWKMYFDGASHKEGTGAGVVFVTSEGEALWAYRTTVRTPTQSTPYPLVYGVETVLPLEQQIPSLRIAIQEGLIEEENARIRLEELKALNEKRLEAQQRLECYQDRLSKAFNKKVRPRSFQVGDLVLAVRRPIITTHRTGNKFLSKWDGPYVVKEAYTNGANKLIAEDGLQLAQSMKSF
ncbi:UNVERIFIED_CONTAM: hypothetical protein Sradi_7053900 [Sesamum radiatum]|uniref:Uncharacterized protein n=1 Tax=Sesamum radiatum TaxID=300843 RepID=A0AAW2J6N6_SESRA